MSEYTQGFSFVVNIAQVHDVVAPSILKEHELTCCCRAEFLLLLPVSAKAGIHSSDVLFDLLDNRIPSGIVKRNAEFS